jgi:hypothetical protein
LHIASTHTHLLAIFLYKYYCYTNTLKAIGNIDKSLVSYHSS